MRKKIVLVAFYEETPSSIQNVPRRMAFLGKALSEDSYDITWIKSGFSHDTKQNLYGKSVYWLNKHFKIVHIPGIGYKHNVSVKRYLHDWVCAKQMLSVLKSIDSIGTIVCSNQNIAASYFACQFAKKRRIPFLFDLRDPWPDAFPYAVKNKWLQRLVKLAVKPDQYLLKRTLKGSSAIISMSQDMLHWGLKKIRRQRKSTKIFYLCTAKDIFLTKHQTDVFSKKYAPMLARKVFRVFYISKWGINFQPSLLVELARRMQNETVDFILCGDGDYGDKIREETAFLSNVFLPGYLSHEEAYFLAKHCHCGIVFSSNESLVQFTRVTPTIPNKVFFHFMCGLPLLNGIPGKLATIVRQYRIGLNFHGNDLQQLQKLLLLLRNDDNLRRAMAKQSRLFFEKHANPEKVYTEYAQFVKGFCR